MSDALWTKDDLSEVKQAIKDLALGKRIVKVSFSGVNGALHSNEYASTDLPQLRSLKLEIEYEIATSEGVDRVSYVCSSKGLNL